ncbi:calcium-binding protein [Pseudorhodobacter ferrugineus]|uniref:calcium-binding protein n=1 Tax=Pseudorhodobacter ferrugineus TaxID=77008 RepID=UPI0003B37C65|nr:calcium-binding protein [Pseudorhodobacter ferrugineus]
MKTLFLLTTAITLTAGLALAQQGTPGAYFIEQWDMDGNGEVTLAEAEEKRTEVFVMFDKAEDGVLDATDWAAIAEHLAAETGEKGPAAGMGHGPGKFIHDSMTQTYNDANSDGTVTLDEFVAATKTVFTQIDRDGDGRMTPADFGKM